MSKGGRLVASPVSAGGRLLASWVLLWLTGCGVEEVRPPWVASALGETVYSTACQAASRIPEHERVYYGTREQAERAGYTVAGEAACSLIELSGPGELTEPVRDERTETGQAVYAPGAAGGSQTAPASRETRPCLIERVIDGDTVVCAGGERVRLLMIDTPERNQAPYGAQATAALEELIRGRSTVDLELDVQHQDQYGRTLAYLWLDDGRMLNEEMTRSGYAVVLVYPPNVRYVERMRSAAAEAQEARRGLWATEAFQCMPVDHRAGRC